MVSALAAAGPIEDGVKLLEAQRYAEATKLFQKEAAKDNPRAMYYLGDMLNQGLGTHRQPLSATAWWEKGAYLGDVDCQLALASAYRAGLGVKLERNYRSTQNIVNTANSLIAKNKEQIPKQVFSEKEQGNKVQVISAYSDFEEGFIVSNRIAEMRLTTHCDYNDFAVLYRTNAQSRVLEEALRKRNIPYRIYGGMSFYQRKEIKDAIAYFRLTINPDDEEALKRVINYPTRGIGNTTLSKLIERAHSQESSIWNVISDPIGYNLAINNGTLNKLKTFKDLIDELRYEADKKNTPELAETIIKRSGIWGEISSDRTPENISRQENIEELLNGVREFCALREEAREEQTSLSDFLAEISLATDQDNGDETEQDKVTLMTVHASDRKSTRLNSSHMPKSRMPSSA